jgi:hypothetical protein
MLPIVIVYDDGDDYDDEDDDYDDGDEAVYIHSTKKRRGLMIVEITKTYNQTPLRTTTYLL